MSHHYMHTVDRLFVTPFVIHDLFVIIVLKRHAA